MFLSKWFIAAFLFFAAGILCVWQGVKLMVDERKRLKNLMDGEGIVKKALVMEKGRGETVVPADTVRIPRAMWATTHTARNTWRLNSSINAVNAPS